jgi:hypothetical protein
MLVAAMRIGGYGVWRGFGTKVHGKLLSEGFLISGFWTLAATFLIAATLTGWLDPRRHGVAICWF